MILYAMICFEQAEDVKALLNDAMLHCAKSAVPSKPVQPSGKQEHGASPLSTANSRLLASNLPGSGDGESTERPVMELPAGKDASKSSKVCLAACYLSRELIIIYPYFSVHPGLDVDIGQFLNSLQLAHLNEIFEQEQVCENRSGYFYNKPRRLSLPCCLPKSS